MSVSLESQICHHESNQDRKLWHLHRDLDLFEYVNHFHSTADQRIVRISQPQN
jgi:hypothetical protein